MLVNDWMTRAPLTVQGDDDLMHARNLMKRHGVRHLPVLSLDQLVGVLSDRDMRNYTPSFCSTLDVYEMHAMLAKLTVNDVMTPRPVTVTPGTLVAHAAAQMLRKKIGCLPVVLDGTLVGILTDADLIRALVATEPAMRVVPSPQPVAGVADQEC